MYKWIEIPNKKRRITFIVLVDTKNYNWLRNYKWRIVTSNANSNYYAIRHGKIKRIFMHRELMNISDPEIDVHHIDGIGLHNIESNLQPMVKNLHSIHHAISKVDYIPQSEKAIKFLELIQE
jgi:hypothetical protein